jgi:hypothetical protein
MIFAVHENITLAADKVIDLIADGMCNDDDAG